MNMPSLTSICHPIRPAAYLGQAIVAATLLLGGCAAPPTPPAAAPSGLDARLADPTVRPQDDLFRAVNGRWLDVTEIPADKARYGAFVQLRDLSDARVRSLLDELAARPQASGTDEAKVAAYYRSFVDTAAIDRAGLAAVKPFLDGIDALGTPADLATWLGQSMGLVGGPLGLYVGPDPKDAGQQLTTVRQAGLGLPERDYYLKSDDPRMALARAAYETYLTQLGTLSGDAHAAATARQVMALERRIAELHWPRQDLRDRIKSYNPMPVADLPTSAPGLDWPRFLAGAQLLAIERVSVSQPSAVKGIARLLTDVPVPQWRAYLRLHALDSFASVLPQAVREARFAFRGKALSGALEPPPRWQQAVAAVDGALGQAVGRAYVARHFPPQAKARMQALVGDLLAAYKESIDQLTWMTPATRAQAQDKLAHYGVKIGYPDRWRDHSRLVVQDGDAVGNFERAARWSWARIAARAGQPVDRSEWSLSPQTVNAYYSPPFNEIVFPAAILQPPFFDLAADAAANYGAIGAVIGHEISHGFDDQGSRYDGLGTLRDWWTEADRVAFDALTARLVAQYEGYEPIPGKHINGKLTLGENIADLSGLQIAFKAYQRSLRGKPSPVIDGTTGEQRFFMGFAQIWRDKQREEAALQQITTDPHSPARYRANGTPVNVDAFHQAFGTRPGDGMYKPEAERIRIW
jgi:putative endopeptidase